MSHQYLIYAHTHVVSDSYQNLFTFIVLLLTSLAFSLIYRFTVLPRPKVQYTSF